MLIAENLDLERRMAAELGSHGSELSSHKQQDDVSSVITTGEESVIGEEDSDKGVISAND